jgi:hypothetical protein
MQEKAITSAHLKQAKITKINALYMHALVAHFELQV